MNIKILPAGCSSTKLKLSIFSIWHPLITRKKKINPLECSIPCPPNIKNPRLKRNNQNLKKDKRGNLLSKDNKGNLLLKVKKEHPHQLKKHLSNQAWIWEVSVKSQNNRMKMSLQKKYLINCDQRIQFMWMQLKQTTIKSIKKGICFTRAQRESRKEIWT